MEQREGRIIYTVSELNREIKTVMEGTYPDIWVEGEISNLKKYSSGHVYFSLEDKDSRISAVLFQGAGRFLKFELEDGLNVILRGRVSVYTKRGDYQLLVSDAEPKGLGALQLAFEKLKEKLRGEGLFDISRKRKIPSFVQKIGIVTSPDGAALHDMLTVIDRRFPNVEILIYPVRVQGEEAKHEITRAIEYLNKHYPGLDVLLVGRGGGSLQDLWAFNEEAVARAIYASKIPVISCVGHEVDYTIADFTADMRAPTPSAAAEMAVRDKKEVAHNIDGYGIRLAANIDNLLESLSEKLDNRASSKVLEKPDGMMELRLQQLDELSGSLQNSAQSSIGRKNDEFGHAAEKLGLVSPLNVLSRGYSICRNERTKHIIKDSKALERGDEINVALHKGSFNGIVKDIRLDEGLK